MAFRRRTTRRRYTRRNPIRRMVAKAKARRFERRVLAIAQKPVETKSFPRIYDLPFTVDNSGYAVGPQWAIRGMVFREIPRADSTLTKSEHEVIGNEFQARGFWISVNVLSDVTINPNKLGLDCRLTVYSIADVEQGIPIIQSVLGNDYVFDPDYGVSNYMTAKPFNMQVLNILKSVKFSMNFNGSNGNVSREKRLWVPIRGRKICRDEEPTITNGTVGFLKGRNYFWLLELFMPGVPTDIGQQFTDRIYGNIQTRVYFKDA